jgi:poly-gamma-glutamate synthesis protein (capsule biosynthesis protein)
LHVLELGLIALLVACGGASPATVLPEETPVPTAAATNTIGIDSGAVSQVTETPLPTQITPADPVLTRIAFTGVIVPARCVQAGVDAYGGAEYIYDQVRGILTGPDLTVGVLNASLSEVTVLTGCERSWELAGRPVNVDALKNAGFDLVSTATNHIKDCGKTNCGDQAFLDTLYHLDRAGIAQVGSGINLDEALNPVVLEANGIRFGFVSLGEINERVFAGPDTPGIAYLTLENLREAIERARAVSDVVIILPHSGPEDYPEVTPQQYYWARHAIEFGADLVVMNHAHVLQGYTNIDGVPVFYSLGNFVFDQIWARDHQQGAILVVDFQGREIAGFDLIPTVTEQDGTIRLPEEVERREILERIEGLSEAIQEAD